MTQRPAKPFTDDPPPLLIGRIGESQGEDAIDRLRSLSEAAEKRAVEEFKERLLSDEVVDASGRARAREHGRWLEEDEEMFTDETARRLDRAALRGAIEAAEKGAS